jgi:hypothetical protein
MRPEHIPELAHYPAAQAFVRNHISMQFGDVRAMLRLPLPREGIDHGCNFAATAILTNLISGVSVVFYNCARNNAPTPGRGRGQRFGELLTQFYPWTAVEGPDVPQKVDALWTLVRNPFAHSGAVLAPGQVPVACQKGSSTVSEIDLLDTAYDIGLNLPLGLELLNNVWELRVPVFYAGVLEMFRRLVVNPQQMHRTEARFRAGQWVDGVL